MLRQIVHTIGFDFSTGSLDLGAVAGDMIGDHANLAYISQESTTFNTRLEIFVLNHNGVVISAPGVNYLLKNIYTFDTGICSCGEESVQNCQYCLKCGHCCNGTCKDYTTFSPEYCTSRAQFYFWLQNCSCMCTVGNCHHCKGCQSCCQCTEETISRDIFWTRCKMHLICQNTVCFSRYLLSTKCVSGDQGFKSKRFRPEIVGFSFMQCRASWRHLHRHISQMHVKSLLPNWDRLEQDVTHNIINCHLRYLCDDQVIRRWQTPQLCDDCNKDFDWTTIKSRSGLKGK